MVPIIVEKCVAFLTERAVGEEGIFRIPGLKDEVEHLKITFNKGGVFQISVPLDTHQDCLRLVSRLNGRNEVQKLQPEVGFEPTIFGLLNEVHTSGRSFQTLTIHSKYQS